MSKVYKIGIIGTKNVGKTTLATQLTEALAHKGFRATIVREVAQDCPLPINKDTTIESGYWLFGTQIAREAISECDSPIVICDRTVLDVIPFVRLSYEAFSLGRQDSASEIGMLERLIQDYVDAQPYDQIFYLPKNEAFWQSTLSRDEIEFRRSLDREFRTYLHEAGVSHHEVTGKSTSRQLAEILDTVLSPISAKCSS